MRRYAKASDAVGRGDARCDVNPLASEAFYVSQEPHYFHGLITLAEIGRHFESGLSRGTRKWNFCEATLDIMDVDRMHHPNKIK